MKKKQKIHVQNLNETVTDEHGVSHLTSDKSNSYKEVSFDVLENAVETKKHLFGYKSKDFSNRAVISSDEVLENKKPKEKKKKKRIGKSAIIILCCILILGAVTLIMINLAENGYFTYSSRANPLKVQIRRIEKYDEEIFKLDEFLQGSINDKNIKQANINKDNLEDVKTNLTEISDNITQISYEMNSQDSEFAYVDYAKLSIEDRIMMIDSGIKIYNNAISSLNVIDKTENFWENISKADNFLKESDNLVQSNDPSNYEAAKDYSIKALDLLNNLILDIDNLNKLTNAFDFNVYRQYLTAKLDCAKCSIDACQALIDQNIESAGNLNVEYIKKSNTASELAQKISSTPTQILRTDYDIKTRPLIDEYKAARKSAAENDYALRNFLNTP